MPSRFSPTTTALLWLMPGTLSLALAAEPGRFCQADLTLDKDQLAAYLIQTYPVSTAYLGVGQQAAPLSSPRALAAWLLDKRAAERSAGLRCSGDSCNVDRMAQDLQGLLDGKDARFHARAGARAETFFHTDSGAVMRCSVADATPALPSAASAERMMPAAAAVTATAATANTAATAATATNPAPASAAAATPAAEPGWMAHVRVRGNPDQLSIDRSNKAAYASVDRARVTLANDDVAQSRTNDVVVYAGYSLDKRPMDSLGSTYEAVPYVGFKQNRVTVYDSGSAAVTTTRTSQIGMLSAFHFAHAGTADSEDLTARPDYLVNNTDGSRLLTVNFTLTPVRPGVLNDFLRWGNGLAFKPILIGQSRNGIYVNRGDAEVYDEHRDFIRLGAQAGFTLASTNPSLPFDFTTTFTGLKALQGARSIHYWKSVLTYNFNQNVGLSLDYANGLLPDSGDPERKWGVAVSSKF